MGTTAFYWQQRQANWLSAFCAFTGLQLHPDKIVIVELGPANPDRPDHIIVHDHAWQPRVCEILLFSASVPLPILAWFRPCPCQSKVTSVLRAAVQNELLDSG